MIMKYRVTIRQEHTIEVELAEGNVVDAITQARRVLTHLQDLEHVKWLYSSEPFSNVVKVED